MRQYRGKRKDNGEWVYGCLLDIPGGPYIVQKLADSTIDAADWLAIDDYFKVDPASVGQSTGLKDKNGVEIFEGDEVRVKYDGIDLIGEVCQLRGGTFYINHKDHCSKYMYQIHCCICETSSEPSFLGFYEEWQLEIIHESEKEVEK